MTGQGLPEWRTRCSGLLYVTKLVLEASLSKSSKFNLPTRSDTQLGEVKEYLIEGKSSVIGFMAY